MEDINRERNNDQFDIETFFLFLIFSVVLEFEIRALHLLNKHSDSLSHAPQPFFALVIFQIGSHAFCPGQHQMVIFLPVSPTYLELQV
jgi:hypothetical protein